MSLQLSLRTAVKIRIVYGTLLAHGRYSGIGSSCSLEHLGSGWKAPDTGRGTAPAPADRSNTSRLGEANQGENRRQINKEKRPFGFIDVKSQKRTIIWVIRREDFLLSSRE